MRMNIAKNFFKRTTKRKEGKYVVLLPFKSNFPKTISLGSSVKRACSQLYRNETRLTRDLTLHKEYNRVLAEYEAMGNMEKIKKTVSFDSYDRYFLTHHALIKNESTSTKVRVVFKSSWPTASGTSLNGVLFAGPILPADLPTLLLRWRLLRFFFSIPISKTSTNCFPKAPKRSYQFLRIKHCDFRHKLCSLSRYKDTSTTSWWHGKLAFFDVSKKAYGAAVYLRIIIGNEVLMNPKS